MGNDQTDKADQTTHRNGCGRDQRSQEIRDQFQSLNVYTHLQGALLSGKDQIQLAGPEVEQDEPEKDIRKDDIDRLRVGKAEVSHQPEDDGMEFLLLRDRDKKHDEGREERTDDDPGQQQCIGMDLSILPTEMEDCEDGEKGSDEGG